MFGAGYANNTIALPPPHFASFTVSPTTGFNRHSHAVHFNGTTVSVFGGSENGTVTATSSYSNDMLTWTDKHPISRISSLMWTNEGPNEFTFLAQRGNQTQKYTYNGTTSRATHAIALNEFHRLDATNFVAVTTGKQIIYANNETFTGSTAVSPPNTYSNPRFHPAGSYIYAIRELGAGNHRLVRFQKTGVTFGPEENLNPGFAPDSSITISGFEFEETGQFIYLNSNLSGSSHLHRISEAGTGLTTLLATNQPGVIVRDGQAYNPFIPANTITSASIMDSSLTSANLSAKTLVSVDFAAGGITTDSIPAGTLLDYHLGTGSLTRLKWETQSIPLSKFAANSFTQEKIAEETLSNRVLADSTLTGAIIAPETFSNGQITAQTIGIDKLKSATFPASVLSQITSEDIVDLTLDSVLFNNLNSASIAQESLNQRKYRTGIFEGENILDGSVQAAQVLSASLHGIKLVTNLWQGALISNNAILPEKVRDNSLLSVNLASSSVNTGNLSDANILSQHLMDDALESDNLPSDVVNARTLAPASITSSALGNNAIQASQFTARIVTGGNVNTATIPGTKLAAASLRTTHVDGFSLADSDKIQAGSLSSRVMAIATIPFAKLQSPPGATQLRTAAFEAIGVSSIDSNKLGAQALEDYHFQPQVLTTSKFANNAVTSGKILNDSLSTRHFANNAFTSSNFAANSVTGGNIANAIINDTFFVNGVIEATRFLDNSIRELSIETHSLLGDRIANLNITSQKIAPLTLVTEDFANNSVTGDKIQLSTIGGTAILAQTLTADKIVNNSLAAARFAGLTNADFSGLTAADLTDNSFSGSVFRASGIDGDRFDMGTITRDKLANGAIQTQNIENIAGGKIADGSVTPAKISSISPIHGSKISGMTLASFADGTIQGDRITLGTLGSGKFSDNAVQTADLADNVDLTNKISGSVLRNSRFVDGSINDSHLNQVIDATYTDKIAGTSVTTQALVASPNFGSAKILDGNLSGTKLADGIISVFAANAVTAGKFNGSATGAATAKIQAGAVYGYHIENRAITEVKLTGTLDSSHIPTGGLSGTDFVNATLNNARFTNNTIPSNRLKNQVILNDAGFFSTISVSQFEALSPAQIANGIFGASDLGVGLTSAKISNLSSANFLNNADANYLIADYGITNSDLHSDGPVVTNAAYINNVIRNSNIALGVVTAGNIATNAFTNSKFQTGTVLSTHFSSLGDDSTDPTVNQVIDPAKGHTHSAYLFKRDQTLYTGGYTLLQNGNFGRANFAYKVHNTPASFQAAQTTCRNENATVCSLTQLASMCDAGQRPTAFSGTPLIREESGNDGGDWKTTYMAIPRVQFQADCTSLASFETSTTSGGMLEPLKISEHAANGIHDAKFHDGKWLYSIDKHIYAGTNPSGIIPNGASDISDGDMGATNKMVFSKNSGALWSFQTKNGGRFLQYSGGNFTVTGKTNHNVFGMDFFANSDLFVSIYQFNSGNYYAGFNDANGDEYNYTGTAERPRRPISVQTRAFFSGQTRPYAFFVLQYDTDNANTYLNHFIARTNGSGADISSTRMLDFGASGEDYGKDLICPGVQNCYVVVKTGSVFRVSFNSTYDPGTLNSSNWGSFGSDKIVKAHWHGTTNKRIYFVSDTGKLFIQRVNTNGSPTGGMTVHRINKPDGLTFTTENTNIYVPKDDMSQVIVSGGNKHVFILNQQNSNFACCRQSLR
ncbi:MAG: hypothetical protein H3C47_05065 [Candidatus Cloacimonetes bacterium]|nr:hypothetical protein [Candidatus Cloacimonadota bacterium]